MKILLDMGHCLSGADTGAVGNGETEQQCTREIGYKVKSKLEALGHTVIICSCDSAKSVGESLAYRVNKANSNGGDIYISIHLNAGGGHGTEIYTWGGKSFTEANKVLDNIVGLGYTNRGIKDGSNLYVIKNTKMKSMLIECCFMDTDDMAKYNAEKISDAIANGVLGTEDTCKTPIMGESILTKEQMSKYVLQNNPNPKISVDIVELAKLYLQESELEGIRGDIAFCQAIKETGFFKYGGDVLPEQNNYCGLGTTGNGIKGAYFKTATEGVKAQIQHLKAYASKEELKTECIDPRYNLVTKGIAPNWEGLNGKWAVPGIGYGQDILKIFNTIKEIVIENKIELTENKPGNSYINIDGGGYASYKGGVPGINLIIKDYSPDIQRIFAWVDNDKGASWAFDLVPPNPNYTKLFKNTSKVVTKRTGGYTFSKGSMYKLKVKGYNKNRKVITENQIVLKVPKI